MDSRQKLYRSNQFWSRGYCAETVVLHAGVIQKYVKRRQAKEQWIEKLQQHF